MIISIIGNDGKNAVAQALGERLSMNNPTIIIDTDLSQPTLPVYVSDAAAKSLGMALDGRTITDVSEYLAQHDKYKGLFYAGTTADDDFLSYEFALESSAEASDFTELCAEKADVIINLSQQRFDPFFPVALMEADVIVFAMTPDLRGIYRRKAMESLLLQTKNAVLHIAVNAAKHDDIKAVEKPLGIKLDAVFPEPKQGDAAADGRFQRELKKLLYTIRERADE